MLAVGISLATLLVRPVFPWDSHQVAELQLWQWPQYVAMFALGIVAAQRGWFDPVPDQMAVLPDGSEFIGVPLSSL
jgi:hypothetical protein